MNVPRLPFSKIKNTVLGREYELSLVFISPAKMRELNKSYRTKDAPTDILSFPLSKVSGEIFLCMSEVKKKAPLFGMTEREYLGYLFIHGLIHLEGFDHGRTMTRLERKFSKAFGFPGPIIQWTTQNRSWHRRRHLPGAGGSLPARARTARRLFPK